MLVCSTKSLYMGGAPSTLLTEPGLLLGGDRERIHQLCSHRRLQSASVGTRSGLGKVTCSTRASLPGVQARMRESGTRTPAAHAEQMLRPPVAATVPASHAAAAVAPVAGDAAGVPTLKLFLEGDIREALAEAAPPWRPKVTI